MLKNAEKIFIGSGPSVYELISSQNVIDSF